MRKRFKIALRIIIVLIILFLVLLVSKQFSFYNDTEKYKEIDTIEKYDYSLKDRDSKLMQNTFKNLKEVLEKKEIDYEKYAQYLSEIFIIDLFSLDNKNNKYDVGGLDYVFYDVQDSYRLNVIDTLYKYLVDKNKREENTKYAMVSSIKVDKCEPTNYTYKEVIYEGYKVTLQWDYEKDFGYNTLGEVILIKEDNKLYVVAYKGVK